MKLEPYVDSLVRDVMSAANAGSPPGSATRLVLLELLSAAAGEITLDLAPGSVDVRLRGRDPEFVVTLPIAETPVAVPPGEPGNATPQSDAGEGGTARMTLRLTEQTKLRIEAAASTENLSVNAWLGRVIAAALDRGDGHSERGPPSGRRFTGWVR